MRGKFFDQDLNDIPDSSDKWELFLAELKNQLNIVTEEEKKVYFFESIKMACRILRKYGGDPIFLTMRRFLLN
ncbi:MAG: hypothetical protein H7235_03010 [Bdellovibrionaceae bacterium]|nr:hypothetical protein [Pseudobdellovibrionaceae bacterium]